ncbi:hypothetical protein RUM43_006453 [Polyplax serrata]|uniref:Uncharacterized protein n=1 Tax=Polyplax serrata TaxID=468196 RepID=A0AAN8NS41_POLSC
MKKKLEEVVGASSHQVLRSENPFLKKLTFTRRGLPKGEKSYTRPQNKSEECKGCRCRQDLDEYVGVLGDPVHVRLFQIDIAVFILVPVYSVSFSSLRVPSYDYQ